ncbi:MAG: LysM peptidoglycan-binding domain-containing protein [Verrucomicrobiales bacterium]
MKKIVIYSIAPLLALGFSSCKSTSQASDSGAQVDPYGANPYYGQQTYVTQEGDYVNVAPTYPQDSSSLPSYQEPATDSYAASSYTAPASSSKTHTVAKGENLYRIGLMYGATSGGIKSANGLTSDMIYPGDVLSIP